MVHSYRRTNLFRHKGAILAHFKGVLASDASHSADLIVAGVHLTSGLTDGSVAAKRAQLENLITTLRRDYIENSWIVAGDFNIVTSSYTINTAIHNKAISAQTAVTLSSIEAAFSDTGLLDAWSVARIEGSDVISAGAPDELFPGEQGATFDPRNNMLASYSSGTSENRAQRYDRILFRSQQPLRISHFNHFGLPEDVSGVQVVGSDHNGVRTSFCIVHGSTDNSPPGQEAIDGSSVIHMRVPSSLSNLDGINDALNDHQMFPTDEEASKRQRAFTILKRVIQDTSDDGELKATAVPMVMVAVGSYALGTWTNRSDIDCLCIGTISSKIFFKLARQRLVKAEHHGIRIVRKVEAGTGTMLELSVEDIAMDLQYCPAGQVVARQVRCISFIRYDTD